MSSAGVVINPASAGSSAHIAIFDEQGQELVYWDEAEWVEDPSLVATIANAIRVFYTEGSSALRERLERSRNA